MYGELRNGDNSEESTEAINDDMFSSSSICIWNYFELTRDKSTSM